VQKILSRTYIGIVVGLIFFAVTLNRISLAHRGEQHALTPAQRAAMETALQNCVQTSGLPALPASPTSKNAPSSTNSESPRSQHIQAMKAYEQALTPQQKQQFEACRKQAFQAAKQAAA
jgi:hypothetical protein